MAPRQCCAAAQYFETSSAPADEAVALTIANALSGCVLAVIVIVVIVVCVHAVSCQHSQ
jgi:hypothetical protein